MTCKSSLHIKSSDFDFEICVFDVDGIDKIISDVMYNKNEAQGIFLTWKNNNRHLIAPQQTDIKKSAF